MNETVFGSQVALGVISSYVMEALKNSPWFPWLKQESAAINRWFSLIVAFCSSIGIEAAVTGHLTLETGVTITIAVPSLSSLLSAVFHTFLHTASQFGVQEAVYQGLIQRPKPTLSLNTTTGEVSANIPIPPAPPDAKKP